MIYGNVYTEAIPSHIEQRRSIGHHHTVFILLHDGSLLLLLESDALGLRQLEGVHARG